jgi:hypothetical protein
MPWLSPIVSSYVPTAPQLPLLAQDSALSWTLGFGGEGALAIALGVIAVSPTSTDSMKAAGARVIGPA